MARVDAAAAGEQPSRIARYIDMVEENVIREDLTFAEMAQVAIEAAADPSVEGTDAEALVGQLYSALHKMKRSYIRSFVFLLGELDGALKWPKALSRNVGVELARVLKAEPDRGRGLRRALEASASADEQGQAIAAFLSAAADQQVQKPARQRREKYEFRVGNTKVTARNGECRIVSKVDFTDVPRDRLELAVRRFEEELAGLAEPRARSV